MARFFQKVRSRLSWGRVLGVFSVSWEKEMTEALSHAFRNLSM